MAAGSNSIVEDWLRSVDLVQYTQSFLDNGYDDLEVCKQIGEDDLDAIGVPRDEHREKLLRAVRVLREEGGTAVYFTLEECDTCQSGDETEVGEVHEDDLCLSPCGNGSRRPKGGVGAVRLDAYDMGKTTLVTYPKVQLKLILRDKLVEDNIDLAGPPFTTSVKTWFQNRRMKQKKIQRKSHDDESHNEEDALDTRDPGEESDGEEARSPRPFHDQHMHPHHVTSGLAYRHHLSAKELAHNARSYGDMESCDQDDGEEINVVDSDHVDLHPHGPDT